MPKQFTRSNFFMQRAALKRAGLDRILGEDNFFVSKDIALSTLASRFA